MLEIFYNSRNEVSVLNKKQQTTLLKNSILLFVLIIFCAILSRCALKGETLSEYEQKKQAPSTINDIASQESVTSTDAIQNSSTNNTTIAQSSSEEDASIITDESDKEFVKEDAMPDRITYQNGFYYESLSPEIVKRIKGYSYPADDANCQISLDDLCYVSVLYYNFDDKEKHGELICNKEIAQDLVEIFYELYLAQYPIEKIRLVDEYNADDELSMADNNTSCFNYRVVAGTTKLSNHSYGLAIDINPFFNPYVTFPNGEPHASPTGSEYYIDRNKDFAYKITTDDLAYKLFTAHGFTWGGNWKSSKDYQHFEKKLP